MHSAISEDPIKKRFFELSYSPSLLDFVCKIYNSKEFSNFISHPFLAQEIYQGPILNFESTFNFFIRNKTSENRRKNEKMKKYYDNKNVKETIKNKMFPQRKNQGAKKKQISATKIETNKNNPEKNNLKIEKEKSNDQNYEILKDDIEKNKLNENDAESENCEKVLPVNHIHIHNIWKNLEILIYKLKAENKNINEINSNADLINYFSKRCGIEKIEIMKMIKDLWEKHPIRSYLNNNV